MFAWLYTRVDLANFMKMYPFECADTRTFYNHISTLGLYDADTFCNSKFREIKLLSFTDNRDMTIIKWYCFA